MCLIFKTFAICAVHKRLVFISLSIAGRRYIGGAGEADTEVQVLGELEAPEPARDGRRGQPALAARRRHSGHAPSAIWENRTIGAEIRCKNEYSGAPTSQATCFRVLGAFFHGTFGSSAPIAVVLICLLIRR